MVFYRHQITALSAGMLLALGLNNANAAGFALAESSIAGLGINNALAANPELLGAVPYNPSLAVFHDGTTVTGGLMVVHPEAEVTTAGPLNVPTNANFQGKDNVFIPNLSVTHQFSDRITLAFSTTVPLGLSTQYPAKTFSFLNANSPTKSQVEVIDFSPSLAFKIENGTSVAFGIDYYWARKVAFDTGSLQNKGDGDGWGWNISASHATGPWSVGASFRSHVEADISGETTITGLGVFSGTSTTLDIPWRAQIGARYEVSPALALEADISRTGWSSFDVLTIKTSSPAGTITSNNHWNDSNAYRLGGTYKLTGDTELRFGYSYDKTPMPDAYYSARIADANRHLFSVGLEKQLGDGLAIDAGYMLVKFKDKNLRATGFTVAGEPNGSLLYNGDYSTTVHLFGVGLSKRF